MTGVLFCCLSSALRVHHYADDIIHPPPPQEPGEACFITDAQTLFYYFWTLLEEHIHLGGFKGNKTRVN